MPTKAVLDLDITNFVQALQQIKTLIASVKADLNALSIPIAGGTSTPAQQAQFRQGIQQIQGLEGAMTHIQNSAVTAGTQQISGTGIIAAANIASGSGLTGLSAVQQEQASKNLISTAQGLGFSNTVAAFAPIAPSLTASGGAVSSGHMIQQLFASGAIGTQQPIAGGFAPAAMQSALAMGLFQTPFTQRGVQYGENFNPATFPASAAPFGYSTLGNRQTVQNPMYASAGTANSAMSSAMAMGMMNAPQTPFAQRGVEYGAGFDERAWGANVAPFGYSVLGTKQTVQNAAYAQQAGGTANSAMASAMAMGAFQPEPPPAPPSFMQRLQGYLPGIRSPQAYFSGVAKGELLALGQAGSQEFGAMMHQVQTGRTDYLGEASALGTGIGGTIGAVLGAPFGGFGGLIGAGVGGQLGSMIAQYSVAGTVRETQLQRASIATGALRAAYRGDSYGTEGYVAHGLGADFLRNLRTPDEDSPLGMRTARGNPALTNASDLEKRVYGNDNDGRGGLAGNIARRYWSRDSRGNYLPDNKIFDYAMNAEELATTTGLSYQGLLAGGFNPEASIDDAEILYTQKTGNRLTRQKRDAQGTLMFETDYSRPSRWVPDVFQQGASAPTGPAYTRGINSFGGSSYNNTTIPGTQPVGSARSNIGGGVFLSPAQGGSGGLVQAPGQGTPLNGGLVQAPGAVPEGIPSQIQQSVGGFKGGGPFSSETQLPGYADVRRGWRPLYENKTPSLETYDETVDIRKTGKLPIYQYLRSQADAYYGEAGTQIFQSNIVPILSRLATFGGVEGKGRAGYRGNILDQLMQFGPSATEQYQRLLTPYGEQSPFDFAEGTNVFQSATRYRREATLGGLQATGSAAAMRDAFRHESAAFTRMPGFEDSLEYRQSTAKFRSARFAAYGQEDIGIQHEGSMYGPGRFEPGFTMKNEFLEQYQRRLQYMPFAPGNIFASSLGIIANNQQQIGVLQERLKTPDLSEQERFSLFSQQQSLMTENARNVGLLSEGFEKRLPYMAAGRPSFFGRYTSLQGAALNLAGLGSPIRAFGAANGQQAQMQDDFVSGFNVPGIGTHGPYSLTAGLSTTNDILSRMLSIMERNSGGGNGGRGASQRPGDALGRLAGALDQIVSIEYTLQTMLNPGKN